MTHRLTVSTLFRAVFQGGITVLLGRCFAALAFAAVLLSPTASFANDCGGVCTEDQADDVYICFYFLTDPCDWYDHWVNK